MSGSQDNLCAVALLRIGQAVPTDGHFPFCKINSGIQILLGVGVDDAVHNRQIPIFAGVRAATAPQIMLLIPFTEEIQIPQSHNSVVPEH